MNLPRFLIGMFVTTAVVAIWAYSATGSLWRALVWSGLSLIVLQVGYFVLAFALFYRHSSKSIDPKAEPVSSVEPSHHDDGVSSPSGR